MQFFALSSGTSEEWDTGTFHDDSADDFQHTFLRQIVMDRFEGTKDQIALIRLLLSSCGALKTLLLIRHRALLEVNKLGRQGGIACPSWLMEDKKAEFVSRLRDGICSHAEIVLK